MQNRIIGSNSINRSFRPEIGNQSGCSSSKGRSHNGLGLQISCSLHCCQSHSAGHSALTTHIAVMGIILIIQVRLCGLCNLHHHLQCFQRIFTSCSLTGKHNSICTVVNSIGNVCHLCSCRTWIANHGIQHLGSSNNRNIVLIALADDHFLDIRNLTRRNLHTKITSGNHNTICSLDDLINIFNAFGILDFGNDSNIMSAIFIQKLTDFFNRFCITDKRSCNIVKLLCNSKQNIIFILLCNSRKLHIHIRNIDSFALSKLAAV